MNVEEVLSVIPNQKGMHRFNIRANPQKYLNCSDVFVKISNKFVSSRFTVRDVVKSFDSKSYLKISEDI